MENFYIYGLNLPISWYNDWDSNNSCDFTTTYKNYLDDINQQSKKIHVYTGKDGKFIIIGKIIDWVEEDVSIVPILSEREKWNIEKIIIKHFNITTEEFNLYFVTKTK